MAHFVDPEPGTIVQNLSKIKLDQYKPIESRQYLMNRLAQSY